MGMTCENVYLKLTFTFRQMMSLKLYTCVYPAVHTITQLPLAHPAAFSGASCRPARGNTAPASPACP